VKEIPADADISSARVLRAFTYRQEIFNPSRQLSPDEVLAIPIQNRQALVNGGFLEIIPKGPARRVNITEVGDAELVIEKPPPWNWKTPTQRQNAEMKAWIEKTLATLIEHDAQAEYQGFLRAIGQLGRLSPQAQRELYVKWVADFRMREARYGNLEPARKALRRHLPGFEQWIKEPPGKRGQPRSERERDERNARLLLALKYVNRLRGCLPSGRWPRALVVEIVAAHYGFGVREVEKALHQGAKEVAKTLRHLIP
jgi:hypothetical protein